MSSKATPTMNLATQPTAPARFRCKVGGEWKSLSSFSNNQQRMIQRMIDTRQPINAAHCGMTCRDHTAGSRSELRCELCGLVKPVEEFSVSSRRNGIYRCKRCIAWAETQEPDVTPAPLETGHVSIEEERREVWTDEFVDSTDFFSDDVKPQAPVCSIESLGIQDQEIPPGVDVNALIREASAADNNSTNMTQPVSAAPSSQQPLPPHLRKDDDKKGNDSGTRSSASICSMGTGGLPPHLRGKGASTAGSDAASECSSSNDRMSGSVSTATTMREGKRRMSFNAWDASGNQYRGVKSATTTTSSAAPSDVGDNSDNWENSAPGRQPALRSKWPKSSECRLSQTELRRQGATQHIVARAVPPVVERQRQQNVVEFREPEDDDVDIYD